MFFINVSLPLFMRHCLTHLLFHMYFLTIHSKYVYASDIVQFISLYEYADSVYMYKHTQIHKYQSFDLYLECRWTKVNQCLELHIMDFF